MQTILINGCATSSDPLVPGKSLTGVPDKVALLANVYRSIAALIIPFYHTFKRLLIVDIENIDFLHDERRVLALPWSAY